MLGVFELNHDQGALVRRAVMSKYGAQTLFLT